MNIDDMELPTDPTYALRRNGHDLVMSSEVVLIKGVAGSAKSRLAMNLIKGFVTGDDNDLGFEYDVVDGDVLYISTEMSKDTLRIRWVNFREFFKEELRGRAKIHVVDIRHDLVINPDEIFVKTMDLIRSKKWGLIVIDQFGDLVESVNKEEDANRRLRYLVDLVDLMKTPLIAIMHQNEGSGSESKARGHLGSGFEQKVALSISISQNRNGLSIRSTKIRSGAPFEQLAEPHYEAQILRGVERPQESNEFDLSEIGEGCNLSQLREILAKQKKVKVDSIRKEPGKLVKAGLLIEEKRGRDKFYSLPSTIPLYGSYTQLNDNEINQD